MSPSLVEPGQWPRRRWWLLVGLVFCGQLGLILGLGERAPIRQRQPGTGPQLHFSEQGSAELLALTDPTVFALPHRQGFSGPAWLNGTALPFHPFAWSEPVDWPVLSFQSPSPETLRQPLESSSPGPLRTRFEPVPELDLPSIPSLKPAREHSVLRVEGELARRRLLTQLTLPSWTNSDILTNTVVQLLVDDDGTPVSLAPLYPGSGSPEADKKACELAGSVRFEPLAVNGPGRNPNPFSHLTAGSLVFEWQTLPVPVTNGATLAPQVQ